MTLQSVMQEVQDGFDEEWGAVVQENPHDELEVSGELAPWKDVLAIYAVAAAAQNHTAIAGIQALFMVAVEIQRTHPSGGNIADDEFRRACLNCGVNPSSFTQSDIEKLTRRLNRG